MTSSETRTEFADDSQPRFDGLSALMDEFHRDIMALFETSERVLHGPYGPLTATAAMDTEWRDLWAGRQQDE